MVEKKKLQKPPITPDIDLHQLERLRDADDSELSYIQRELRRKMLLPKKLKELRLVHLWEMVVGGYTTEQIVLAFAVPDSPLNVLLDGFSGKAGLRTFMLEIRDAQERLAKIDTDKVRREAYINDRRHLRDACWAALGRVEAAQSKVLLELIDKVQQDIAEAYGVLVKGPGKHRGRRAAGSPVLSSGVAGKGEAPSETDPESTTPDWESEEEFEPDDAEDSAQDQE